MGIILFANICQKQSHMFSKKTNCNLNLHKTYM